MTGTNLPSVAPDILGLSAADCWTARNHSRSSPEPVVDVLIVCVIYEKVFAIVEDLYEVAEPLLHN